jgi:hypothetical protein
MQCLWLGSDISIMNEAEKEEILTTYKWIKVRRYVDDERLSIEERFKRLQEHHVEETSFLIDKIKELIKQH